YGLPQASVIQGHTSRPSRTFSASQKRRNSPLGAALGHHGEQRRALFGRNRPVSQGFSPLPPSPLVPAARVADRSGQFHRRWRPPSFFFPPPWPAGRKKKPSALLVPPWIFPANKSSVLLSPQSTGLP